uniref:Uncharacterized protein n=1 Tax=Arundo donax TaxID=35708 RepID=A0A0A9AVX5_ARUDO
MFCTIWFNSPSDFSA